MILTPESKVIIQGIDQSLAAHYTAKMKAYGTNIVAGISPGQSGSYLAEIPIFDLVEEAVSNFGEITTTIIFVPAYEVLDAGLEAIASGIKQLIIISANIPPLDMVQLLSNAEMTNTVVLGPDSEGIIIPEKIYLGISNQNLYRPGNVGIISRTDSLSYEVAIALNQANLGQSFIVNIGKQGIIGSSFDYWLKILAEDENTTAIVLIGKPVGSAEENAAKYISNHLHKPVIAYLPGIHAPLERTFEDAATIIANQLSYSVPTNNKQQTTIEMFEKLQIPVAKTPAQIPSLFKKLLKKQASIVNK